MAKVSVQSEFFLKKLLKHKLPRILISFVKKCCQNLPKRLKKTTIKFHYYLKQCDPIRPDNSVSINVLKETFFCLQTNKSHGDDGIGFNVVKHYTNHYFIFLFYQYRKKFFRQTENS